MGSRKNLGIRSTYSSVILRCQYVVSKFPKLLHYGIRKILIRVKKHSPLLHEALFALFAFMHGTVDFSRVFGGIFPGSLQVIGGSTLHGVETFRLVPNTA